MKQGRFSMAASFSSSSTSFMQQENKIRFTLPAHKVKVNVLEIHKRQVRCFYDLDQGKNFVPSDQTSLRLERNHPRLVGSSHGWLAFLEPSDCSLLLKKLSTTTEPSACLDLCLPPIETLPDFTGKVYHVTDMDKPGVHGYGVAGFIYRGSDGEERFETSEKLSEYFVDKLMLTSDPSCEDCAVVMTTRSRSKKSKLVYCRPGDLKWRTLDTDCGSGDIVYYPIENKFYGIFINKSNLEIEVWDLKDPNYPEKTVVNPDLKVDSHQRKRRGNCYIKGYLVEALGNIFLVARHYTYDPNGANPFKTFWFDVIKLSKNGRNFEVVDCLSDQAFFLDSNQGFAVSASVFPGGAEPNSIYFGDCYLFQMDSIKKAKDDHEFDGVFNLEDKSIKGCHPVESKKLSILTPASGAVL